MENRQGNILVVGGTSRNLGKTEYICRLLSRFSSSTITVVKIKTLYHGDEAFHGRGYEMKEDYVIREENEAAGLEDSRRFLAAGATSVLYIRSRFEKLGIAVQEALSMISTNDLIIFESNSVVNVLQPAVYIMLAGHDKEKYKPSSRKLIDRADIIIRSSGNGFGTEPEDLQVSIRNNAWELKP